MGMGAHPSLAMTRGKSLGLSMYATPITEGFPLASSTLLRSRRSPIAGSEYGTPMALKHNTWLLIAVFSVRNGTILRRFVNTDEDMFAPYAKYQNPPVSLVVDFIVSATNCAESASPSVRGAGRVEPFTLAMQQMCCLCWHNRDCIGQHVGPFCGSIIIERRIN